MSGNLCRCGAYVNIVPGDPGAARQVRGEAVHLRPARLTSPRRCGIVAGEPEAVFLAGGTNLVDHLKLGVARPDLVVDVRTLTSREVDRHRRRRPADRRRGDQQRAGRRPAGARALPGAGAGAARRRDRAAAQHGDHRRQSAAAHPLRLLPGRHGAVQQARARQRLLRRRRLHPLPRGSRGPAGGRVGTGDLHRHPSVRHGRRAGRARRAGAGAGPHGDPRGPVRRAAPAARRRPVPRHGAGARRADHRDRPAAAAARHAVGVPQGA